MQLFFGEKPQYLGTVRIVLAAFRQRKKNEARVPFHRQPSGQCRVPVPYYKDARSLRISKFGVLDREVLRQIVARVAITREMRVEPHDDGSTRIEVTPDRCRHPGHVPLEIEHAPVGEVKWSIHKEQ